jgi:hypothetical protein
VEKEVNSNIPLVVSKFHLNTIELKHAFFKDYAEKLLNSTLPPLFLRGFAFEAHGQNTVLILGKGNQIQGFCMRDYGGVSLYEPFIGDLKLMNEAGIVYKDLKHVSLQARCNEGYGSCVSHSHSMPITPISEMS